MAEFEINGGGLLTKYNGSAKDVVIPKGVKEIGESAFYENKIITSVVIPEGVTSIGKDAFKNCTELRSAVIPEGVDAIGYEAFECCGKLTSATLPSTLRVIDSYAFNGCSLARIIIPDGVTEIRRYAFASNTPECIVVPSSVIGIGEHAFGCYASSLRAVIIDAKWREQERQIFNDDVCNKGGILYRDGTPIDIPSGITTIWPGLFKDCTSLTHMTIPEGVNVIESEAFKNCSALLEVTIPEGVTRIDNDVFAGCTSLTSLTIPESVTVIKRGAFADCTSLGSVVLPMRFRGSRLKNIFGEALADQYIFFFTGEEKPEFEVEDGTLVWYHGEGGDVRIPEGVTKIAAGAFSGCMSLTSVSIPDGVTELGDDAFLDCAALSSAVLPKRFEGELARVFGGELVKREIFTFMEDAACYEIEGGVLKKYSGAGGYVALPDNVTAIGDGAFKNCAALTAIKLSDNVTSIGREAFAWCRALKTVKLPNGLSTIADGAFYVCTSLTSVNVPYSVSAIGNGAFAGCASLTAITLPSGVKTIGNDAFRGCVALSSVTAKGLASVGSLAFAGCASLSKLSLANGLGTIGARAFAQCRALVNLTIPDSVNTVGVGAFERCDALESITLPRRFEERLVAIFGAELGEGKSVVYTDGTAEALTAEVTVIPELPPEFQVAGGRLMRYLGNECEVCIPDGITAIDSEAFLTDGESPLQTVHIPASVTEIEETTFADLPRLTAIIVAADNPAYRAYNGALYTKDLSVLLQYPVANRNTSYTAPEALLRVAAGAFYYCRELHYVNLGNVREIGNSAFLGCLHLFSLAATAEEINVGEDAFAECWKLEKVEASALLGKKDVIFPDSRA